MQLGKNKKKKKKKRKKERKEKIKVWKERSKSVFTDDSIVYTEWFYKNTSKAANLKSISYKQGKISLAFVSILKNVSFMWNV